MKTFKLEVVLSSIYGVLLCQIGDVYNCLQYLADDDSIMTHQLGKAGMWAQPLVEGIYPFLKTINLDGINPENWQQRLTEIKAKYPNEIELAPMPGWPEHTKGIFGDLEEILTAR